MAKRSIKHRVERTRNKHSRAVIKNDTVIIRLAKNLSKTEEREHIRDLLKRMAKHVVDEQRKQHINPFRKLLSGAEHDIITIASGKQYTFHLHAGERTMAYRTLEGWVVFVGPRTKRKGLHAFLWELLAEAENERIDEMVRRINDETFGKRISKVRLKFAATQWGSCSPRRIIMINAALLFVPPSLLRYVIIHELAHLVRADHSRAFWREVEWAMPTYEKALENIQEFRLPTL